MRDLSCKNCGGIMVYDVSSMTAYCRYCGTSYVLDHKDTDYYKTFYRQMVESSAKDENSKERDDRLWDNASVITFATTEGQNIELRYLYSYSDKCCDVYVTRRNIAFHFRKGEGHKAEYMRKMVSSLDYPSADTRTLSDFFPRVTGAFVLDDGTMLVVINKREGEYPLRLFGKLGGRHIAWVISRLENLCCVLEYNGLVHPDISLDSVYINPNNHTACLYCNWWDVERMNTRDVKGELLSSADNLLGLRKTAEALLKTDKVTEDTPKALLEFIRSTPRVDAYEDFAYWDDMLIRAFGKRKFIKMETTDSDVYGKEDS